MRRIGPGMPKRAFPGFFCMILGPHANPELFRIRMERKIPGVLKFFYYI